MSNNLKSISLLFLWLAHQIPFISSSFNIFPYCDYIDGLETVRIKCFGEQYGGYSKCFSDFTNTESAEYHRSQAKRLQIMYGSACEYLDSAPLDGFFWNIRHLDYSRSTTSLLYSNLRFRYLEVFDASHNELSALTAAIFYGQLNLREIDFSYNYISIIQTGTFDQSRELSTINLAHNSLATVDRDTFSSLAKLKQLDLSFNQIIAIDRYAFGMNVELEVLRLQMNPLKRFDCHILAKLGNLRSFDVSLNSVVELDLSCTNCKLASIDGDAFAEDDDDSRTFQIHLNGIKNSFHISKVGVSELRLLNLAEMGMQNATNFFDSIGSSLELLDLSSNHVGKLTSNTFAKFLHLKHLKLSNTDLTLAAATATGSDPFHPLTELMALDLSNNNLATTNFAMLSSTLAHLSEFNIANCHIENVLGVLELLSPAIETLDLAFNSLQSVNSQTFQRFVNLKSLNLSHTQLKQFEFTTFFQQNQLKILDLSYNYWTEVDFSLFIRKLTNVEVLNLEGNQLHAVHGLTSSVFPQLNSLGLSKNRFTCDYLAKLLFEWPNLNLVHNPTRETHIDGTDCILNYSNDENLI